MGHGAPRLKQGRSWGLSSGRAGATGAACKLAPHDHDQPAGALPAGAARAASLNGGRNACAPTSTITPAPPVPRSRVQPDGHSLHPQTCHCTRSARENTSRSGCIFCIRAPAAAPALATSQRSSGGRSRSCGNGSSSGCECSDSSEQQLSVCARPHTPQTCLGFQRSQAALVDNGAAWAIVAMCPCSSPRHCLAVCAGALALAT